MTETTASVRTEWRIQYENANPDRERNRTDMVTPLGDGRFRHEIRAHSLSEVNAFRDIAKRMGAADVRIAAREVVSSFGRWREVKTVREGL